MSIALLSILLLASAFQILLYAIIFGKLLKKQTPPSSSTFPPVSVIVAAHNEAPNLQKLVPLLLSQEYPQFEIIIANDRSTDNSEAILEDFAKQHPSFRFITIKQTPPEYTSKKFALTQAIQQARYDTLLFTDADCWPTSPHWIKTMCQPYTGTTHAVLGFSPYVKTDGLLNQLIRYETFITGIQYLSFALWGKPYMGVGRNISYQKSLFRQQKGFGKYSSILGGDDDLFINGLQAGTKVAIALSPNSQMLTEPKHTWREWYIQKKRHLSVGKHYQKGSQALLGLILLSHFLHYFLVIILTILNFYTSIAIGVLLIRLLVVSIVLKYLSFKLHYKISIFSIPLLDSLYLVYLLIMGGVTLTSKRITWS
ncbi:glycosyltransferase [Rapidithrix thailandica]|uniref:Glycosyltransferase n=1 Tax=Rapidithrix thailandica TaxID=413964 RepID=A0AAW9SCT9_9BACT